MGSQPFTARKVDNQMNAEKTKQKGPPPDLINGRHDRVHICIQQDGICG